MTKIAGKTKSVEFQAGARRTFAIGSGQIWKIIVSAEGQALIGGDRALSPDSDGVSTFHEGSHYRRRERGSGRKDRTLQVRVLAGSGDRSTLALHAEHLVDEAEREEMLDRFRRALDALPTVFSQLPRNQ